MFSWELPLAQSEIAQLGPQFTYRSDVKSFDIEYKESGSSNVSSISTSGTFVNNKMRTHTVGNLIPGREYQFRIRSVDLGNQVGAWSRFFGYTSGKAHYYFKFRNINKYKSILLACKMTNIFCRTHVIVTKYASKRQRGFLMF